MNSTKTNIAKIDLEELIREYRVDNIEAFSTYLKQVWKDLTNRSDQKAKGINKMTFEKYYELTGIISERLFSSFDVNKNGYLDCQEFITGMTTLFNGDFDELIQFIFNFYDFDKDDQINKEDIRIVLSYVPLKSKKSHLNLKFEKESFDDRIESQEELHNKLDIIFQENASINEMQFKSLVENDNSDIFLYILIFILQKRPFNNETIKLLETIKKSPERTKSPNKLIVSPDIGDSKFEPSKSIMKNPRFKSSTLGSEFNQAKDFLSMSSGRINVGNKSILNYELKVPIDDKEQDEQLIFNNSKKHPTRKSLRQVQNLDQKVVQKNYEGDSNIPLEFAKPFEDRKMSLGAQDEVISSEDEYKNKIIEGYLYKINENKLKRIYFKFICKDMYFYKSKEDDKHKGMHNLSGVYVNEDNPITANGMELFCFHIVFPKKVRKYYCDNFKEYKEWVAGLRKVAGYANLSDLYEIEEVLGKGKFGLVRLGVHKTTKRKVSIKIVNKKSMSLIDLTQIKTEIEILKIAQHPNIIRLYDVFENEVYIYIIMEYCKGGDLFSYIEKRSFQLSELHAANIMHKLCTAVFYLHEYGIIHRDLKPENILMTDNTEEADIRLLDFGLGKIMGPKEFCNDPFGTLSYVAPEVLLEKPYNNKVDLWALGIIAYLLVAGFLPFDDETSEKEIARQTVYDPPPFPASIWKRYSLESKMFICNLLSKEPDNRMNIREVLEHKWLQNYSSKQREVFKRRKNRDLSGGDAFKAYSVTETKDI